MHQLLGYKMFQATTYEIFPYQSRNQSDFTSWWKATRLRSTGNPDIAMRRASHKPGKKEQIEYY